jgi:hypothetical protein
MSFAGRGNFDRINKIYTIGRQADLRQEKHELHEGKSSLAVGPIFMSFMFLMSKSFPKIPLILLILSRTLPLPFIPSIPLFRQKFPNNLVVYRISLVTMSSQ